MYRVMRLPVPVLVAGLVLAAGLFPGCSSKEIRYPADHARYRQIDKTVEMVRDAYSRRDLSDIQGLMLPRERLEKAANDIRKDFETFQEIELEWTLDRIVIEEDTIEVVVNWAGQWRKTPSDPGRRERGQGVLLLAGETTVLVNGMEGDLPFGMSLRRADAGLPRP